MKGWIEKTDDRESLDDSELNGLTLILIYVQQDATLHSLFYLETALHVSGGATTHHQERKCICSIWYLSHRYCYLPL